MFLMDCVDCGHQHWNLLALAYVQCPDEGCDCTLGAA
jgi:hypothetical protein